MVESEIAQYYENLGGNPNGVPVMVIAVNIESRNSSLTDQFIANSGLKFVLDDTNYIAWSQFGTGGIPHFAVINGTTGGTYDQWEVLHSASGWVGSADYRGHIDLVDGQPHSSDPYDTVVATAGLTGSDAEPGAMPHKDGVSNLLKFAFNMNLAGPDAGTMATGGIVGLPTAYLTTSAGQPVWRVEYVRRKGTYLTYAPQKSTDMANFGPMTGTPIITSIDDVWERVTVDEPRDPVATPKLFIRLQVTK